MNEPINPYASPHADLTPSTQQVVPGLRVTSSGLLLIYYGIIVILLVAIGLFIGTACFYLIQPSSLTVSFSLIVGSLVRLLGFLCVLIGQVMCISVPWKSGKWYIIVVVILQIIYILSSLWSMFISHHSDRVLITLVFFLSTILFVLFLRKLSAYIGRRDLVDQSRRILILLLLSFLFAFGMLFDSPLYLLLFIILPISVVICIIMARLVYALRNVILSNEPGSKKSILFAPSRMDKR